MTIATIGARYQVVIPAAERQKIGLKPHDKVAVDAVDDGILIRPISGGRLRGLGCDLHDEREPVDYVREMRAEWGTRA